jgi:hypothetical protein
MEPIESTPSILTCINCSTELKGNFCTSCGQRANVKRITFREGWNDFWARIYGFDGMFAQTLRDLTIRPGAASRRFIDGNRVAYYGPVGYFFLMITLLYLVASLLNINLVDFLKNSGGAELQEPPKPGSGQEKLMQSTFQLVSDNLKLISFIVIPIQAFCSRFLFFRKSTLNFTEHMVLPFYGLGHLYWLSIASLFMYTFTGSFLPYWIQLVVAIVYFSYAYSDLFQYQSRFKTIAKGFGVYIATQLLFALITMIVVILLIVFDPDVYEMVKPSNNR